MPKLAILTLAAVAVLMFKHTVADFYLQTPYQYLNKGTYGHPGGFLHAGIHAALTPFVYLVLVPSSLLLVLGITLTEFAVHYHGDWLFWYALGTDQLLHGLTYVAIVAALVAAS